MRARDRHHGGREAEVVRNKGISCRPVIVEAGLIARSANHDAADRQFAHPGWYVGGNPKGTNRTCWRIWAAGSM